MTKNRGEEGEERKKKRWPREDESREREKNRTRFADHARPRLYTLFEISFCEPSTRLFLRKKAFLLAYLAR